MRVLFRKAMLRWVAVVFVGLLILSLQSGSRGFSAAERAAAPFAYNLVQWELRNFLSKWLNRVGDGVWGGGASDAERAEQAAMYFRLGGELGGLRRGIEDAAGRDDVESMQRLERLQGEFDAIEEERRAVVDDVEETIEGAISGVIAEEGLGGFGEFIFPPVDIRLGEPPKLLVVSPRNRIYRMEDVLLRSGVTLGEREAIEAGLLRDADLSALVEDIGGVATYPASLPSWYSMRWTLQVAAHEWLHHYFFFKPLGQHMFDDGDMTVLNETIANVVGDELGDRAYVLLGGSVAADAGVVVGDGAGAEGVGFDFRREMSATRRGAEELLGAGDVEGAEAYMEERRRLFVENGYAIRKINQAYFAFYGTYADLPASVSPIGGEVRRFRELVPDLGDFVDEVSGIGSYEEFLGRLGELEAGVGG